MTSTALRVKELLKEFGWTTKVLAEKTGMSESYLTHIKNGTRRWNEDALKKIAEAFEKNPIELFQHRAKDIAFQGYQHQSEIVSSYRASQYKFAQSVVQVPVLREIPDATDPELYRQIQAIAGTENMYVPSVDLKDPALFALQIDTNTMAPRFLKGDVLLVSPKAAVVSGDCVVLEYKHDRVQRAVMIISYMDDVVVLEHPHHKLPPVAMTRSDHYVKILGKVIQRYQKY